MRITRILLLSLAITLVIWGVISWPLPMHALSGIPASPNNTEMNNTRTMIAGDHLQFLYHMWLAKDTLFGPTPLFYNLYEFNRGSDEERKDIQQRYYLPFSLMYSLCSLGGHSAGWNGTGILALWITFIFMLLLAKRYTIDENVAWLAAAISIIFPYRWITLLGGSPSGLAMMWAPIIYYGLDVMVRDKKAWGGALAGASIFLSGWCDPHVMFFTALSAPCWCIICYLFNSKKIIPNKRTVTRILAAAAPLVIFGALVGLQAMGTKSGLEDTVVGGNQARALNEVQIFSPHINGVWAMGDHGKDSHIYIGWFMTILLFAAMIITVYKAATKEIHPVKILLPSALLFIGMIAIVLLATGTNNPIGGSLTWVRLCRFLPPYGMIRQPAKIFIILPIMMAVFASITFPHMFAIERIKNKSHITYLLLGILLTLDYSKRVDPTICELDTTQGAYEAIAEDAKEDEKEAFALGLPLWPGDSHWSSINQYYSTLHRIRMVNGYRPTRRQTYFEDIFMRFESFNKGGFTVNQLKNLWERGVNYIVLQEDAFPEKVSPFPVSFILSRLLEHPNIKLLKQDGPVWAFKIVRAPGGLQEDLPDWSHHFPARLWQAERSTFEDAEIRNSENTSGNRYLELSGSTNSFISTGTYPMSPCTNLCFMVRARGNGSFKAYAALQDQVVATDIKPEKDWSWYKVQIPIAVTYPKIQLRLNGIKDPFDVDLIVLATDDWDPNNFKGKVTWPAPVFFHAGHTDLETGEVILSPDREPADVIFYGPKLPFPAGSYRITFDYTTDVEMGTILGELKPRYPAGDTKPTEVIADEPGELIYHHPNNLRLAMDFKYSREAEMRIKSVTIEKMEDNSDNRQQTKDKRK